jgi:hypothetical protein
MPAMRVFPLKRKASGSRCGHIVATIIGPEELATAYPGYLRRRPNPNHRVNSKPEAVWPPPKRGQAKTLIKKTGTGENAHLGAPCVANALAVLLGRRGGFWGQAKNLIKDDGDRQKT